MITRKANIRPIAIYLPQFHPIPENDKWWGKGFTEWTNVTKARPLFKGHYQPHLPTDLGFYDLRLEESRLAQEALAKEYGIFGFCYYHYWFNGKKLLNEPIDRKMQNHKEDFPFMFCWANENWTRRWDGKEHEVLMEQSHSEDDDIEHIKYLIKYFKDDRYIKVNGKAVFILYKTFLLPDPSKTAKLWRQVSEAHGVELYLCHMVFGYRKENTLVEGFDAVIDFEPFGIRRQASLETNVNWRLRASDFFLERIRNNIKKLIPNNLLKKPRLNVIEYSSYFEKLYSLENVPFKIYPSIVPSWDNSARRPKNPTLILKNSTPELFGKWLEKVANYMPYSNEENFLFINAWNEWAEGNHLEPCAKWKTGYLEEVKKVFRNGQ